MRREEPRVLKHGRLCHMTWRKITRTFRCLQDCEGDQTDGGLHKSQTVCVFPEPLKETVLHVFVPF